ncbi:MAG: DnaD domain protein [SAR202 cluster bacterium]|nr:DnaD domain protein [SAR202 cluster bacterium]
MKKHEFTISISSGVLEKSIKNLNNINEIKIFLRIIHLIYQKQNLNTETFELSFDEISNDPVTLKLLGPNSLTKDQITKKLKEICDVLIMKDFINQKIYTNKVTGITKTVFHMETFEKTNDPVISENNPKNIFELYEDNVGMLNPMIVDELIQAENKFPFNWIVDAVKESTTRNKRNWKYIHTILETWDREGKNNGRTLGNSEKTGYGEYFKRK